MLGAFGCIIQSIEVNGSRFNRKGVCHRVVERILASEPGDVNYSFSSAAN